MSPCQLHAGPAANYRILAVTHELREAEADASVDRQTGTGVLRNDPLHAEPDGVCPARTVAVEACPSST